MLPHDCDPQTVMHVDCQQHTGSILCRQADSCVPSVIIPDSSLLALFARKKMLGYAYELFCDVAYTQQATVEHA